MLDAIDFRPPPPPPMAPLALRPRDAAQALGICTKTLRGLPIPTITLGRAKLYMVDDLRAWLQAQRGGVA